MKKRKIYSILGKIINFLIIKSKKRVYVAPHPNCLNDKYDLGNYSSDNVLCILHYFKENEIHFKSTFYIEYHCRERLFLLQQTIKQYPFRIKLIYSHLEIKKPFRRLLTRFRNMIVRYSCRTWITDTGSGSYYDKMKWQKFICLGYATPLKVDGALMPVQKYERWTYINHFLQTSLLTACVLSSELSFKIEECPILGYPRNDMLNNSAKKNNVYRWLEKKVNFRYKKIIVYAPTYRDYDGAYQEGCAFGFKNSPEELEEYLSKNDYLLITKFHPLQKNHGELFTQHIVQYEKTWDFSLYDLLAVCDVLVSDYSSVIHDFILTGKPIVIDAFDYDKYKDTRGFAFEPLDLIMPSKLCLTFNDLLNSISSEAESRRRSEKYLLVQKMFHKYIDFDSSKRVADFLMAFIK